MFYLNSSILGAILMEKFMISNMVTLGSSVIKVVHERYRNSFRYALVEEKMVPLLK